MLLPVGGPKGGMCMEVFVTRHRDFKKVVRSRMVKTGESYAAARMHLVSDKDEIEGEPSAKPWHHLLGTSKEEAKRLLKQALDLEPRLTYSGLGVGDPSSHGYWIPGERPGSPGNMEAFGKERAELWEHLDEIAACADWIRLQRPIASFNLRRTSYGYKHVIERWIENRGGPHLYIANGSFVAAAVGMGFPARQGGFGSPNACFQFSEKTVKTAIKDGKAEK